MTLRELLYVSAGIIPLLVPLGAIPSLAAEPSELRPADLVGSDAAVVCEIPRLKANSQAFRQSELFERFVRSPLHEHLRTSPEFQQWQQIEAAVTAAAGQSLSSQLLELFSREVALAAYLSPQNQPEGVLIAQADQAAAVDRFLQTWKTLEPNVTAQPRKHQGQTYYLRPASGGRKTNLFYVSFGSLFAVSDHESRIQQVIELRQATAEGSHRGGRRLTQHPLYDRAGRESDLASSTFRLLLLPRAWDGVWQDSEEDDAGLMLLRKVWPALEAMTLSMRITDGLHVDFRGLINPGLTNDRWKAWCQSVPDPLAFLEEVPADAVLVVAGGIHFQPLWQTIEELASEDDRESWNKARRMLEGVLGGRDVVHDVMPVLTQQAGLYLVRLMDSNETLPWDGMLSLQLPESEQSSGLYLAMDQTLSSVLTLLSVQLAEKFPGDEPAAVHVEFSTNSIVRWLQTSRPLRFAYQATPSTLRLSRSRDHLQPAIEPSGQRKRTALESFGERWLTNADLFLCVDLQRLRENQSSAGELPFLARPKGEGKSSSKTNVLQALQLGDMAYLTAQFNDSNWGIRLGLVVDTDR